MAITDCRFFRFSLKWIDVGFRQFIARDAPARTVARRTDFTCNLSDRTGLPATRPRRTQHHGP